MDILSLLIVVPVLTILAIAFTKNYKQVRVVAAIGTGIQLFQSFNLVWQYLQERAAGNTAIMVFTKSYIWFEKFNIKYDIGVDGISVALIALTGIIVTAGVYASWGVKEQAKEFFIWLLLLATGVFGFFIAIDLFTMFVFYEIAVIPMYLLIGVWGSGKKEYSAMKLTLMLMGASAILLVAIIGLYIYSNPQGGPLTWNILELASVTMPIEMQRIFFPMAFVGFGALGALFPFHTWSPDGHASAPTAVSMLHAGVLMKLGGYGALRIAVGLMPEAAQEQAWFFMILTAFGAVYGAFGAIMQTDLKYINAYSSVSHLAMILFAILMFNATAMNGAVLQMISHGFITALFFSLIGMIYGRTHTRDIYKMGGLMRVMPILAGAYMVASFASLGLPGFSAFVAEMTIFVGAFQHPDLFHRVATILVASSIVVTAVYILRAAGILLMGPIKNDEFKNLGDALWYEKVTLIVLIGSITVMGMAPLWLSDMIMKSLTPMLQGFVTL
jgi:NADH-quinone oxidoreductase subunit M